MFMLVLCTVTSRRCALATDAAAAAEADRGLLGQSDDAEQRRDDHGAKPVLRAAQAEQEQATHNPRG